MLTDEVLDDAARRATRRFDAAAVLDSAKRAGARVEASASASPNPAPSSEQAAPGDGAVGAPAGFVAASRRMALSLQSATQRTRTEPGKALIELLGFADAVTAGQPPRPRERLSFPILAGLAGRPGAAS